MYRPKNINAIPTAFIPPAFGAADNGKLLVCVYNFHGQTSNQLSLNVGDRIVLIKCGSKGWIFAKQIDTQRYRKTSDQILNNVISTPALPPSPRPTKNRCLQGLLDSSYWVKAKNFKTLKCSTIFDFAQKSADPATVADCRRWSSF